MYLVRCRDGTLYCGITTDLDRRISEHNSGNGAKYIVPGRRPVKCVWNQMAGDRSEALRLEHRIKMFSTEMKKTLVRKGMRAFASAVNNPESLLSWLPH